MKLADLLKAAGLTPGDDETTKKLLAGELPVEKIIEAVGRDEIAKALGVTLPTPKPTIEKATLAPDVKAYVDALEQKVATATDAIDAIVKQREDEAKAKLAKRIEALKGAGIEIDPEKATEAEVAAYEKAAQLFDARLKKMGVLTMKADPEPADEGSAAGLVRKEVARRLGREPIDKLEDAKTRREIYRANPGLLKAVTREERVSAA